MRAFAYLVFPNSPHSVLPEALSAVDDEPRIMTSVTHGLMSGKKSLPPLLILHMHARSLLILKFVVTGLANIRFLPLT